MSDEDAFQKRLDDQPEDFQARLVFADWLQERGDPRAEGYRCLGVRHLRGTFDPKVNPWDVSGGSLVGCWSFWVNTEVDDLIPSRLPLDWFDAIDCANHYHSVDGDQPRQEESKDWYTRREAENAATVAFARLSPERCVELLAGEREAK